MRKSLVRVPLWPAEPRQPVRPALEARLERRVLQVPQVRLAQQVRRVRPGPLRLPESVLAP